MMKAVQGGKSPFAMVLQFRDLEGMQDTHGSHVATRDGRRRRRLMR